MVDQISIHFCSTIRKLFCFLCLLKLLCMMMLLELQKLKVRAIKNVKSVADKKDEIRLKGHCLLATKSDINELIASTSFAYALVCKDALFQFTICNILCPLLLLTFCRSILMSFQVRYQRGYHQYEGLSTKLILFLVHLCQTVR